MHFFERLSEILSRGRWTIKICIQSVLKANGKLDGEFGQVFGGEDVDGFDKVVVVQSNNIGALGVWIRALREVVDG